MHERQDDTNSERWKPVVGYEGYYEVSDKGRVRSLHRTGEYAGRWRRTIMNFPAKEMTPYTATNGYQQISLKLPDGKGRRFLVHRLVMAAFVGPANGLQVNHKDGVKTNNAVENLEYCTSQQNLLHLTRVLKKKIGERSGMAKLKEADINPIRNDPRTLKAIAAHYGVTLQAVWLIKKRKNWFHVRESE